jgi:hypothetical protein
MNVQIHPEYPDDHESRLMAGGAVGACATEVTRMSPA